MPFFKNQLIKYKGQKGKLLRREGEEWLVDFPESIENPRVMILEDQLLHWTEDDDRLQQQSQESTARWNEFITLSETWSTYLVKIEDTRYLPGQPHPRYFTGRVDDHRSLQVQWDNLPVIQDLAIVLASTPVECEELLRSELYIKPEERVTILHSFPPTGVCTDILVGTPVDIPTNPFKTAIMNLNKSFREFNVATNRGWLPPHKLRVFILDH